MKFLPPIVLNSVVKLAISLMMIWQGPQGSVHRTWPYITWPPRPSLFVVAYQKLEVIEY